MNIKQLNEELDKILFENKGEIYVFAGFHELIVSDHKIPKLKLICSGKNLDAIMNYFEKEDKEGTVVYTRSLKDEVTDYFGDSDDIDFVDL